MGSYEDTVRTLEVELGQVEQAFRGLTDALGREPMATPRGSR
jgi:transcriptional regulator of nitric oxide reductase